MELKREIYEVHLAYVTNLKAVKADGRNDL